MVEKVKKATEIAKQRFKESNLNCIIDGELQVDGGAYIKVGKR
jgi:phosphotransacetylase